MKKFLLLAVLSITSLLSAQKKLLAGTITDISGKTVNVYLEAFYSQEKWKVIQYKLSPEGDWQNIPSSQVSEVRYDNGLIFRRFTISVEKSRPENRNLQESAAPIWTTETTFLQLLVGGNYELYRYSDEGLTKFFYKTTNDPIPVQLVYIRYSDREQVRESRHYPVQLMKLFNEPEQAYATYQKLPYSQHRLVEIFREKSGSTAQDYSNASKQSHYFKSRIKLFANFNSATLEAPEYGYRTREYINQDFTIVRRYDFTSTEKVHSTVYQFGVEGEFFFLGLIPKMCVVFSPAVLFGDYSNTEISYEYLYRQYHYMDQSSSLYIKTSTNTTGKLAGKYVSLNLPLGLRYYFLDGNNKCNVSAQGAVTIPCFANSTSLTIEDGTPETKTDIKHKSSVGLIIGAEYAYQRYSIRLQYGRFGKLYEDMGQSDWNYLSFGLGYALKN